MHSDLLTWFRLLLSLQLCLHVRNLSGMRIPSPPLAANVLSSQIYCWDCVCFTFVGVTLLLDRLRL